MNALEIKKRRKELGLNQEELAKKLGVSVKTISNYETGDVIPESKKELLRDILYKKEEDTLNEPSEEYKMNPKEKIKLLERIIALQDEISQLRLNQKETDSE